MTYPNDFFFLDDNNSFMENINKNKSVLESKNLLIGKKILLIEANNLYLKLTADNLKNWGVEYAIAENGKMALGILENENFDCVLMDFYLLNRIEFTNSIRDINTKILNHRIPIIALNADVFEESKFLTKKDAMDFFLLKPFDNDALYELILLSLMKFKEEIESSNLSKKSPKLINLDFIEKLIGDDNESIIELLKEYVINVPIDYQSLVDALETGEMQSIRSAAHKIKSSFNTFGLVELGEAAKGIEQGAKENIALVLLIEKSTVITSFVFKTIDEAQIKIMELQTTIDTI